MSEHAVHVMRVIRREERLGDHFQIVVFVHVAPPNW
jgi:hypothetical protein